MENLLIVICQIIRNDWNVFRVIPIIHKNMNYTTVCEIADVCREFYNVQNLSDLSTNVAGDPILKFLNKIN
jgi:hypothetical protein